MDRVRLAVVGAGWISQIAFLPGAAQAPGVEVVALVSGSEAAARSLAAFHGIAQVVPYEGFDALMASDTVDAVYIALPNSMHCDYAVRAARAGKHVLVEKPLALDEAECRAIIAAAEAAGVWLMTAYRLHSDPGTVAVLEAVRAGEIGDPRYIQSAFSFQSAPDNHRLKATHWGGPLQDIGVYCLNAARHVFGAEPVQVMAMAERGPGDARFAEVDEAVAVTLRFPGGRLAQFTASFGAADVDMYRIVGTEGEIVVDPGFLFQTDVGFALRRGGQEHRRHTAEPCDHFGAMATYFADCIRDGVRPEPDGEEGMADVIIMRAIEESLATGRAVGLDLPERKVHPGAGTARQVARTERRLVL